MTGQKKVAQKRPFQRILFNKKLYFAASVTAKIPFVTAYVAVGLVNPTAAFVEVIVKLELSVQAVGSVVTSGDAAKPALCNLAKVLHAPAELSKIHTVVAV